MSDVGSDVFGPQVALSRRHGPSRFVGCREAKLSTNMAGFVTVSSWHLKPTSDAESGRRAPVVKNRVPGFLLRLPTNYGEDDPDTNDCPELPLLRPAVDHR